jgi:hypothetical protein
MLHEMIDPRAALGEILAQHVVIRATWRHAGTLDGDNCLRRKLVEHSRSIPARLGIVDREALHDGDAAETLVTRRAFRFSERHDRQTRSPKRRSDGLQQ